MDTWSFIEIARLVENKQAIAAAELALEARPLAEGWLAFGGKGSYVNKACGVGMERPLSEDELEELVTFFTSRGVEPRIELSPFVHPSFTEGLARRGFVLRRFANVLARSVSPADQPLLDLPGGWPKDVRVERVNPADGATLREYVEVAESGFLEPGELLPPEFLETGLRAARRPTQDAYVARIGEEIAGAGGCESSGGVTALFGTSVKPAFRGRGIQQALIAARLDRARERGSQLAVIISTPGISTERNAVRLGFEMSYSRAYLVMHGPGLSPSA